MIDVFFRYRSFFRFMMCVGAFLFPVASIYFFIRSIKNRSVRSWGLSLGVAVANIILSYFSIMFFTRLPESGFMSGLTYLGDSLLQIGSLWLSVIMMIIFLISGLILFPRYKKQEEENFHKVLIKNYDPDATVPILRCSICNGEQVAGFKDLKNGTFDEIMVIRNAADLEVFKKHFGIEGEIRKEY